jgi:hypothetical protein
MAAMKVTLHQAYASSALPNMLLLLLFFMW